LPDMTATAVAGIPPGPGGSIVIVGTDVYPPPEAVNAIPVSPLFFLVTAWRISSWSILCRIDQTNQSVRVRGTCQSEAVVIY